MKMLIRSVFVPAGALLAIACCSLSAGAQAPPPPVSPLGGTVTTLVSGLQGPRGLAFGPDGDLYVAEGGTGGTNASSGCQQVPGPIGPYTGGLTARISKIDQHGNRTTVASNLPSAQDQVGDVAGVADVAFLNGDLYALIAAGGCSHGNPSWPNGIIKVNTRNGNWKYITDLSVFYAEHPAAYVDNGDFEADGEPYSLLAYNGSLFSTEANHGQLIRTSADGVNHLVADISANLGHIVPTGLAEANGNLYVTNLGQFPITPEWEKLMTFSRDTLFIDTTPGLATKPSDIGSYRLAAVRAGITGALALKFGPDGLLYVLEFSTAAGYPAPGTGKVVRLKRNGTFEDVVTGLVVPTGMTFGPDRALYVSNFGAAAPGAGQIVRVTVTQ